MRSKERLIEVLKTVNPHLYPEAAEILWLAAEQLPDPFGIRLVIADECLALAESHPSEHIRDLAADVIRKDLRLDPEVSG